MINTLIEQLEIYEEQKREREQLKNIGLTDEEVEGYFEYFADSYVSNIKSQEDN